MVLRSNPCAVPPLVALKVLRLNPLMVPWLAELKVWYSDPWMDYILGSWVAYFLNWVAIDRMVQKKDSRLALHVAPRSVCLARDNRRKMCLKMRDSNLK